jgi:hypothetical protein
VTLERRQHHRGVLVERRVPGLTHERLSIQVERAPKVAAARRGIGQLRQRRRGFGMIADHRFEDALRLASRFCSRAIAVRERGVVIRGFFA